MQIKQTKQNKIAFHATTKENAIIYLSKVLFHLLVQSFTCPQVLFTCPNKVITLQTIFCIGMPFQVLLIHCDWIHQILLLTYIYIFNPILHSTNLFGFPQNAHTLLGFYIIYTYRLILITIPFVKRLVCCNIQVMRFYLISKNKVESLTQTLQALPSVI